MIYTKMTKVALNLCFEAHRNQRDKNGMPYVFHPFHMAEQMKDEKTTIVALLHDVVEDTDITLDDIRNMGFDNEVVAAIGLMTHAPDVPYMEYVAEIKKNPISKAVKLADFFSGEGQRLSVRRSGTGFGVKSDPSTGQK